MYSVCMKGFLHVCVCMCVCARVLQVWFTGFSGESIWQLLAETKRKPAESI